MPRDVTYSSYLDLDRILSAQHPASGAHDEMLFIIIHQASELWLKLCLHELTAAREEIKADDLRPAFKMLARVARAQGQLISSWDVLSTMTPADYSLIRPHLASSSGFQSAQYRLMEFLLGGRNPDMVTMHEATPEVAAALRAELARPSLYDEAVRLLARRGFSIPAEVREREHAGPWQASPAVEAAWADDLVRRHTGAGAVAGDRPSDDEVARLLRGLLDVPVRDAAASSLSRSTAPGHVAFWTDVVRRTPAPMLAAPAALLALAAWHSGDGALAWCALDRCAEADEHYPLAALITRALEHAVPPPGWDDADEL